jgi:hypothetical protein
VFPQLFDVLLGAFTAMVWMVQDKLNLVERHTKTGAMGWLYYGPQVVKQGLNFPPMNVCADRFLEYYPKQV